MSSFFVTENRDPRGDYYINSNTKRSADPKRGAADLSIIYQIAKALFLYFLCFAPPSLYFPPIAANLLLSSLQGDDESL